MKTASWMAIAVLALANTATAAEAGSWKFRAGPYLVSPKSDNGDLVRVDDGVSLGFNISYFWTQNWAVELLAATPFSHDIKVVDGPKVAKTKHLPPTLTVQYHFDSESAVHAYVGAGLNYTLFFDEKTSGPLEGTDLSLSESFGLAAQLGADWQLNDRWLVNLEVRYIDIETDAKLDGANLTTAIIDPWVTALTLGIRF